MTESTAVATRDGGKLQTTGSAGIQDYLDSIKPKLEEAATKHLTPDRLIRVFLGIAVRNPKIYECTRESIVNALSQCTSTGLEPGGILKHADLIPRWNKHAGPLDGTGNPRGARELYFQPRYGGLAELARRSGEVTRVNAAPVYQGELDRELFVYSHEPPAIRHDWAADSPALNDKDIIGGYAVAELVNGCRVQLWMSLAQIDKRRQASAKPNGNFWTDWFPEMVRKTLLRSLFSGGLVPMSEEMSFVMAADTDMNFEPPEKKTRIQRNIDAFRVEKPAPAETVAEVIDAEAREVAVVDSDAGGHPDYDGGEPPPIGGE